MLKKFFATSGLVLLLASCETASQKNLEASKASSETVKKSEMKTSKTGKVDSKKSIFAKGKETAEQKLISVGDRVLFDYDSAALSSESKLVLDKQSRFLRANPDLTFTIEGHCDERGTREYNLALGEKRATAVRDYLVIEGISSDRLRVISYGKEKPAVIGSNDMAWSKNRRAVTTID